MAQQVAFLRGINNIGSKTIRMDVLKKVLLNAGFRGVRTIGASGNILFDMPGARVAAVKHDLGEVLQKKIGGPVHVIIWSAGELKALVGSDPFKGLKMSPETKPMVTLLSKKMKSPVNIPYDSPGGDFSILAFNDRYICSVTRLMPGIRPYRVIAFLEKEFGSEITNRSWNTIVKIAEELKTR